MAFQKEGPPVHEPKAGGRRQAAGSSVPRACLQLNSQGG